MQLEFLADHPHLAVPLAQYHHAQWCNLLPWWSYDEALTELQSHQYSCPTTLVALEQGHLLGSASLVTEDLPPHELPEFASLSPWLASVFVIPSARHQGTGRALVQAIEHHAQQLHFTRLHLLTEDKALFYQHLGWSILAQTHYRNHPLTVMVKSWG